MKQRHDLIPALVETVRGVASHERTTLEAVIKARSAAVNAGVSSFNGKSAPTNDLRANPRPIDGAYDVGAYELGRINNPPLFDVLPYSDNNNIAARTLTFHVRGQDDGGEGALIYSWSIVTKPDGAPAPTYNVNQSHFARDVTVRFRAVGMYTFSGAAIDADGGSVSASVTVTLLQKMTEVIVSPNPRNLLRGQSQRFVATAVDQFARAMAIQPAFIWSKPGIGRVNSTGRYYAPDDAVGFAQERAGQAQRGNFRRIEAERLLQDFVRMGAKARRRAMRCTPIESTAVTTAGRPSGTAATARATPRRARSSAARSGRSPPTRTTSSRCRRRPSHPHRRSERGARHRRLRARRSNRPSQPHGSDPSARI